MFYNRFIFFYWFYGIFGFWKSHKDPPKNMLLVISRKTWTVFVILSIIINYSASKNTIDIFDIKSNLSQLDILNQFLTNLGILFIELINSQYVCTALYNTMDKCFYNLKVSERNLKYIALKLYFWFCIPTIIFLGAIFWEIFLSQYPPFTLLFKIPSFLAISHLVIHLYLILSTLKSINGYLSTTLLFCDDFKTVKKQPDNKIALLYLLDINECFINNDGVKPSLDIQFLCRIYDDVSTCMKLLEKYHGFQILLAIWLMFSNAVIGIPLVTSKQAKYPSVIINNAGLTFLWFIMGCYVQDQIKKEVEKTDNLIIKHLIDFRCDQHRKSMLHSFRQLVGTERLKFTACSLFELSYSMVVGTVLNIVTYSIILIQLVILDNVILFNNGAALWCRLVENGVSRGLVDAKAYHPCYHLVLQTFLKS